MGNTWFAACIPPDTEFVACITLEIGMYLDDDAYQS